MNFIFKKITAILVLTSFLTIIFFSFDAMAHNANGHMAGDCPFSAPGTSFCPQDALAVAIHHISSYYEFLNVPVGQSMTALVLSFVLLISASLILFMRLLTPYLPVFVQIASNHRPHDLAKQKLIRWLSLFETVPPRL